jgi:hypothetical protein
MHRIRVVWHSMQFFMPLWVMMIYIVFFQFFFSSVVSYMCYKFDRVNQSLFSASTNTENYASGKHVRNVCLPAVSSTQRSEEEQVQNSGESYKSSIKPFVIMDHQIPNLVTLSLLPKSQWQSLTNLDIIKVICLSGSSFQVSTLQSYELCGLYSLLLPYKRALLC